MTIFINPGSGPVHGATEEHARANLAVLVRDVLEARGVTDVVGLDALSASMFTEGRDLGDGRFGYEIIVNDKPREIEMPGLPLDQVRFVDAPDQNIWDFPRLYVDGSSWVWKFAVNVLADDSDDEEE